MQDALTGDASYGSATWVSNAKPLAVETLIAVESSFCPSVTHLMPGSMLTAAAADGAGRQASQNNSPGLAMLVVAAAFWHAPGPREACFMDPAEGPDAGLLGLEGLAEPCC